VYAEYSRPVTERNAEVSRTVPTKVAIAPLDAELTSSTIAATSIGPSTIAALLTRRLPEE